ncbi:MAG: type I-A CRISPR-associated protein Cas7/Csa2 [Candidatus Methanomethylicia archaeon]
MFIKLTARMLINVHDLNNEASVGNFTDIRKVKLINEAGEVIEAPAVSGNMLKHWHFIYMKRALEEKGYNKLCSYCLNEEAFRIPQDDPRVSGLRDPAEIEEKIVNTCAIEDLHGYLYPGKAASRRESLVKFSWLIPVLNLQSEIFTATHSRVARGVIAEEVGEEKTQQIQQQMLFYKQYSSGLYGFSACLDLAYVGIPFTTRKLVISDRDRSIRVRSAIEAFIPFLTGEFGASQCRALPIIKIQEILITYSRSVCLPNPTAAVYSNYLKESISIYEGFVGVSNADVLMMVYPRQGLERREGKLKIFEYDKPLDMFRDLVKETL